MKKIDGKHFLGNTEVCSRVAASILSKASGFMAGYDFTLNPYSGCSFGCTYCYAAFFSRNRGLRDSWGHWLQVKENALELLKKLRKKPLTGKCIYMSSVTDPYQPIEKELLLTRSLLQELADFHQPRLVIQTRSPLVMRDVDLLLQFRTVQVNMTITTDSERVRKIFEPYCPSNQIRLEAIRHIQQAGIESCITLTPLLPVDDPKTFAQKLSETGIRKFIVQPLHPAKGGFVGGTGENALKLIREMDWTTDRYQAVVEILRQCLPHLAIGREGFKAI